MKKSHLILAIVVASFWVNNCFSQDSKFGVRLGVNFSSFSGADSDTFVEGRTGYVLGFYYDYIYTDKFGMESGLMYSKLGAGNTNDSSTIKIGYIDLPIIFKYYVAHNVNIHAGPQFSLLSDANFGNGDYADEILKLGDFSGILGIEYKFNFGLCIIGRYQAGLMSVGDEIETYNPTTIRYTSREIELKNNAFQVSLNYLF